MARYTCGGDLVYLLVVVVALVVGASHRARGQENADTERLSSPDRTSAPPTEAVGTSTATSDATESTSSVQQTEGQEPLTERTAGAALPGEWGLWTSWAACSKTCGSGSQRRSRRCLFGVCLLGNAVELRACTVRRCEVAREPQPWSTWTACTVTCGGGTRSSRRCRSETCDAYDQMKQNCNGAPCPQRQQATWSRWSAWGSCTAECIVESTRTCSAGEGQCGSEPTTKAKRCSEPPCTGEWSSWSGWTSCSLTCGRGGEQRRTRSCPRGALVQCPGRREERRECYSGVCSTLIPKSWTQWSRWSECAGSCGSGRKERSRTCRGTDPSTTCPGNDRQRESCTPRACSGTAATLTWRPWSPWGACSRTCGAGQRLRARSCPQTGQCSGFAREVGSCRGPPCETHTEWSGWSRCSATCGRGESVRTRTCLSSPCAGTREVRTCNAGECEDGPWQKWGLWSQCSVSCGVGNSIRTRDCGQGVCNGHWLQVQECRQMDCEGSDWAEWSKWETCSVSCGVGQTYRSRACLGDYCKGSLREVKQCAIRACPGATLPVTSPTAAEATTSGETQANGENVALAAGDSDPTSGGKRSASDMLAASPMLTAVIVLLASCLVGSQSG
ncbi:A disintegrin and metalloproteinase with thrombospondin motifs adt-1-like [Sycon ciliatum]|uniref:A disintegrin and metalloproteinase with thrombospondin motifs adt-1-like n=1 Tax=Sycon ciliatum TaxID=27933 RepID=UPI0031F5F113|eukprot:scpid26489/ scgid22802/ Brain-specific angiogenesis inhibitor 1